MPWLVGILALTVAVLTVCGLVVLRRQAAGRRPEVLPSPTWPGAWASGMKPAADLTVPMGMPQAAVTSLPEGVHLRVVGNDEAVINECIFDDIVEGLNRIPPLPHAIILIMRALEDLGSSARSVADIVATEPVLAATILRVCNSAAMGIQRQIVRVDQAVSYLGFSIVKSLVFRAKLAELLPGRTGARGYDAEKLWLHSLAVGQLAEHLAARVGRVDPALALTVGLLHDIGKLAINSQFPQIIPRLWQKGPGDESFLGRERRLFGADHAHIGSFLAARWKLPAELTEAIRLHHRPEAAAQVGGEIARAVEVVMVANQLAKYTQVYCEDMEIDILPESTLQRLGLPGVEQLLDGPVQAVMGRSLALAGLAA